eukprot:scaffold29822_cov65-Cyclotella_meneghiniana.AAC.2
MPSLTTGRNTLHTTTLAFTYDNDEYKKDDYRRSSVGHVDVKIAQASQQSHRALTRQPSSESLVSLSALQNIQDVMGSSRRTNEMSLVSVKFKPNGANSLMSSKRSGSNSRSSVGSNDNSRCSSYSNESFESENEKEGKWRNRVSQLFSKPFASITRNGNIKQHGEFSTETKSGASLSRPKRRVLHNSLDSAESISEHLVKNELQQTKYVENRRQAIDNSCSGDVMKQPAVEVIDGENSEHNITNIEESPAIVPSPTSGQDIDLNNALINMLYIQQNPPENADENVEPDEIGLIQRTFEKASRRASFQRSVTESFNSARSDAEKIQKSISDQPVDSTMNIDETDEIQIASESNNNNMMQTTDKSAVSSMASYASPTGLALVRKKPTSASPGQFGLSSFTNMALVQTPALQRKPSMGSMSSLGNESINRIGVKVENYSKTHCNEPKGNELMYDKKDIDTDEQQPSERNDAKPGDQSSITMGSLISDLQKTLTEDYQYENRNITRTSVVEALDISRRKSGTSSLTPGTFFEALKEAVESFDGSDANNDEGSVAPEKFLDGPKDSFDDWEERNLNDDDVCDFDSGLASFTLGMTLGHFNCHDEVLGNVNTDEDDDHYLAAKAFMGLGFAAQLIGENEKALDWYMKALQLLESEIGTENSSLACLHYIIGVVLSQEKNELEASVHLNNALGLLQSIENADEAVRASILSTEGMIFSVLGEVERSIDYLRKALLLRQTFDLHHATIMYEMGTLLAQQRKFILAVNCYLHSLSIREKTVGNSSFVVMQTHYSIGVTLAQDDSPKSWDSALMHLHRALQLCGDSHIQSPIVIHAIGVLNEKKGDYHTAANWFYKELSTIKLLYGEDDERVAMCSNDVGCAFYQIGKYGIANQLFENALRFLLTNVEDDQSPEVADLLYKIASCHECLCEYNEALGIFQEVKQIRISQAGVDSSPVIQTMLRIGNIQLARGEAEMALECFNEIVGFGYTNQEINSIEVANAFYGKGCAQFMLYQLIDAMKSLNESLNWKLAALGEDNPGLACIFYQSKIPRRHIYAALFSQYSQIQFFTVAHVYLEQSEEKDAIFCFEEYSRLLRLDQHRNLEDNAEICRTSGLVCKLKGELDNAFELFAQALAMYEALFDQQNHEKIATIHFDLGCIHALRGSNKKALQQFQRSLDMRKQLLGTHIDVANVLFEMAMIFQRENMAKSAGCSEKLTSVCHKSGKLWKSLLRYAEAEGLFEKALELAISIHGQKHMVVAEILLDLGELLHETHRYEQAIFCFDESLGTYVSLFGTDDIKVASVLYRKGVAMMFENNMDEALTCFERALKIRQMTLGHVDHDVADTLNAIGYCYLRMGNIMGDCALAPLTKALDIRRNLDNKGKVVSTLQNLASLHKRRKEFDLCIEMHSEILALRQEEFGTNDEKAAEAWVNLGNVQTSSGRLVEATISYEEALRIRTLNGDSSIAQVVFKLGVLSSRQNNCTKAKQLFEEYIRLRAEKDDDPDQEVAQALTLIGDIQSTSGERSKAKMNWSSAIEIYSNLGYPEEHPKVVKLKARQKNEAWFTNSRLRGMQDVIDAPRSLFSRLSGPDNAAK